MKTLLSPQTCEMSTLLDIEVRCGGLQFPRKKPCKTQRKRFCKGEEVRYALKTPHKSPASAGFVGRGGATKRYAVFRASGKLRERSLRRKETQRKPSASSLHWERRCSLRRKETLAKPSEAVLPGRGGVIRTKNTPAKAQRQRVLWGEEAQRSDTQFSAPAGNGASVVCADDRVEPARQVPRDGRLPADEAPVLDRRAVLSRIRCHPGSMCSFRGVIRKESV